MIDPALGLDDQECHELFAALFPHGFAGQDVLEELAPCGWEASPLSAIAHPTPEQVHEESQRMHQGIESFAAARRERSDAEDPRDEPSLPREPPSLEEIRAEHQARPFDPPRELRELVGMCLWDVFSNNHEVSAADGRIVVLGSHRAAGGFLAEVVNRSLGVAPGAAEQQEIERLKRVIGLGPKDLEAMLADLAAERESGERVYDYSDFYLGTRMVDGRADLAPVYRMVFRRLLQAECDWRYHFPRLFLADLRPLKDALRQEDAAAPEWAEYDPSSELQSVQEGQSRDEELAKVRANLDDAYRQSVEAAREQTPPATVGAYRAVYDRFPEGWPPEADY